MEISELIKRFVSGEFSKEDHDRITGLLNKGERIKEIEEALRREWSLQDNSDKNLDHLLHKLHFLINTEGRTGKRKGRLRRMVIELAAAALLATGVFFSLDSLTSDRNSPLSIAEMQAPLNARVQFTLPDGTVGWLNSGSTLRYPLAFTQTREVELFGEAFFDVEKTGDKQPFNVVANGGKIVVLGTRFNVVTDEKGLTAEVILEEGEVDFLYGGKNNHRTVSMKPGDRLVYNHTEQKHILDHVNPSDHIQWINGRFVVRGESVTSFIRQFGRQFNMDVEVADKRLDNVRFRATFENESPEEILRLLELITPVSYTIKERELLPDGTFTRKKVILRYSEKKHDTQRQRP